MAGLALVVVAVIVGFALGGRRASPPPKTSGTGSISVGQFIHRAEQGLKGSFVEWYRITTDGPHLPPGPDGTIEVAQRRPPEGFKGCSGSLCAGSGVWSYVFRPSSASSWSSQWIEKGTSSWDCWEGPGEAAWTCTGPGTFAGSNGFLQSIAPYVSSEVRWQLGLIRQAMAHKGVIRRLSTFRSHSARFGPLDCLTVKGRWEGLATTMCIDRDGQVVSQQGAGGYFWESDITLLGFSRSVPSGAFTPLGTVPPGSGFVTIPS